MFEVRENSTRFLAAIRTIRSVCQLVNSFFGLRMRQYEAEFRISCTEISAQSISLHLFVFNTFHIAQNFIPSLAECPSKNFGQKLTLL